MKNERTSPEPAVSFKPSMVWRLAFVCLTMGLIPMSGFAGIPIEKAQREFQARYYWVNQSYASFPTRNGCTCEEPAPAFPADGFYGDLDQDPGKARTLVQDLKNKVWGLATRFVGNNGVPSAGAFITVNLSDLPNVSNITETNYPDAFQSIQTALGRMSYVQVGTTTLGPDDLDGTIRYGNCIGAESDCDGAMADALTDWEDDKGSNQGSRYACVGEGVNSTIGFLEAILKPYYGSYSYGYLLTYEGRIRSDLTNTKKYPEGSSGVVYAKCSNPPPITESAPYRPPGLSITQENIYLGRSNSAPFSDDWSQLATVNRGDIYTSDTYGNIIPTPTLTCADSRDSVTAPNGAVTYYAVVKGWQIDSTMIVHIPRWKTEPDEIPGACSTCEPGAMRMSTSSSPSSPNGTQFNLSFGLGKTSSGDNAGNLYLSEGEASPNLATPAGLKTLLMPGVNATYSAGVIQKVVTATTLAKITVTSPYSYQIEFYDKANFSATTGNPTGVSFKTVKISNPAQSTTDFRTLKIEEITPSGSVTDQVVFPSSPTTELFVTQANGFRKEGRSSVTSGNTRTDTLRILNSDNSIASKVVNTYQTFPWGEELISSVSDPDGAPQTTTWTYDTNTANVSYGRMTREVYPNLGWSDYRYDAAGRVIKVITPLGNNAPGSAEASNMVEETVYSSTNPVQTIIQKRAGVEIGRQYVYQTSFERRDIQATASGAAWNASANLVNITKRFSTGTYSNEVQSVEAPDGTFTLYSYSEASGQKTTTVKSGVPNAGKTDVVMGTRTEAITDSINGGTISNKSYDIASGLLTGSAVVTSRDNVGRALKTVYLDGTSTENVYGCCGLESSTDREGVSTRYLYNAMKQVIATTRDGISTMSTYDAEGRMLTSSRQGVDGSVVINQKVKYDAAGRQKEVENGLGYKTTFTYSVNSSTGKTTTTATQPDGSTTVEITNRDGTIDSRSGTAVRGRTYSYGRDADGVYVQENFTGTGQWVKSYSDFLGRNYKTVQSNGAVSQSIYNARGQLEKSVDPDGVTVLYRYNSLGDAEDTAVDFDPAGNLNTPRNGVMDYAGTDRISRSTNYVSTANGSTVRRSIQSVFKTDGSAAALVTSTNDVSVDGLKSWNTSFSQLSSSSVQYTGGGGKVITSTGPDGVTTVSTYQKGRLRSQVTSQPSVGVLGSMDVVYDAHGRQKETRDAMGLVIRNYFDQVDRLIRQEIPRGNGQFQVTKFDYDNMGRRIKTTLPDGGAVNYEYYPTGELKKVYGTRTYTTDYTYDVQGRLKTMVAGGKTTTWNYNNVSGFLDNKRYADNQGADYTYTVGGRLKTRAWARGVTTTYDYNQAGEIKSIDYGADPTPGVTYDYDRRGRVIRLSGSTETVDYNWHDAGMLNQESHTGGPLAGYSTTNQFNSKLLRTRIRLRKGTSTFADNGFTYDGASRLKTATNGAYQVAYTYLPNTSLVSSMAMTSNNLAMVTINKKYDDLYRVTEITATPSADSASKYAYSYNDASQRTRMELQDGSYWVYEYDQFGQVVSGKKFFKDGTPFEGQEFGYSFDSIGNRTSSSVNVKNTGYTANNLNQYTAVNSPGYLQVAGTADETASVYVNQQKASRNKDYFFKELPVDNSTSPKFTDITVTGTLTNAAPQGQDLKLDYSGKRFTPKASVVPTFDADGNQLTDGRWINTWDAENRLITQESVSTLPDADRVKLEHTYDYSGRRIQTKVSTWNGTSYTLTATRKFVYDGWNLIGEFDAANLWQRLNLWGLDLSGSEQGAGGVGGLLLTKIRNGGDHFVTMDANGNVSSLVSVATGKYTAQYEYGPFGELLRSTGSAAKLNPYRFSTKYQDEETGLSYYGYRYYDASTGRWLSRDPLEEEGGENLYGIGRNDFINEVDSLGMTINWHHLLPQAVFEKYISNGLIKGMGVGDIHNKIYGWLLDPEEHKFLHGKNGVFTDWNKDWEIWLRRQTKRGKAVSKDMIHKRLAYLIRKSSYKELFQGGVRATVNYVEWRGIRTRGYKIAAERVERLLAKTIEKRAIKTGEKKGISAVPIVGWGAAVAFFACDVADPEVSFAGAVQSNIPYYGVAYDVYTAYDQYSNKDALIEKELTYDFYTNGDRTPPDFGEFDPNDEDMVEKPLIPVPPPRVSFGF